MILENEKKMFKNLFIEKYRPQTFDDIILEPETRKHFQSLKDKQEIPHLLFSGPPGIGKTSLAKIIAKDILDCQYLYINASDENGIDTIRSKVMGFAQTKSMDGKLKVVIFDECDALTQDAQKALRSVTEEYASNTRFIFTCNYLFKVITALQSRCQSFNLAAPMEGVVKRVCEILKKEDIQVPTEEKPKLLELIRSSYPDIRTILNTLQKFTHDGCLSIKENKTRGIAQVICKKLRLKESPVTLRAYVIEREQDFLGDYHQLLKDMFDVFYTDQEIDNEEKANLLLVLSDAMYKDAIVIDKEINWFAACIRLNS